MEVRSQEIREDVELDRDWNIKRPWGSVRNFFAGRGEERGEINWPRFVVLVVVTAPFVFVVIRFLNRLLKPWAKNGLNFFELILLGAACWAIFAFYRWLAGLAR